MIFELRRYNMNALPMLQQFDRHMGRVSPVFEEMGFRMQGAWNYAVGEDLPAHTYLLCWENLAEREATWQRFYGDPRWAALRAQLLHEAGGEAVRSHSISFLEPASYWRPDR